MIFALLSLYACGPDAPKPDSERPSGDDSSPEDTAPGDTTGTDTDDTDTPGAVVPVEAGGRWVFTAGELVLEVEPATGGRIARLALGGTELLTDATVDPDNWGATFWTSPQSAWSWPPPAAIDAGPYTATLDGTTLVLTSAAAPVGGATFVVEKRITVGDIVTVTYTVQNAGDATAEVAGWQITRVPAEGLTFFPAGAYVTPTTGTLAWTEEAGHVWISHVPAADAKVLADGADGWLAHVANGILLVQRFPDVRLGDAAPGDAEIEVFANGGGGYREIEAQSAYTSLAPGDSLAWTVTWEVRRVPSGVVVEAGSAELVGLVGGS